MAVAIRHAFMEHGRYSLARGAAAEAKANRDFASAPPPLEIETVVPPGTEEANFDQDASVDSEDSSDDDQEVEAM